MYRAFQKDIIIIAHDVHVGGPFASEGAPKWRKINLCNILRFCRHLAKLLLYFPKICPETILPLDLSLPHKIAPKKTLHKKSISDTEPFFRIAPPYLPPQSSQTFWFNIFPWRPKACFPCLWILIWKETRIGWRNSHKNWFLETKFQLLVLCLFLDGPRIRIFTF